ncbi:probable methyltransferase At1g27930 isoform X3 [Zingiber officinale]|uniref:probable methyltransferase At1g27930 isoform X3 n=1 Tax=Zingiber officinale TaxID=94328 RepID=UPI001C4B2AF5|nr:probable methyltransferase At1g27930 isoform X3 [Zingiber officinale]
MKMMRAMPAPKKALFLAAAAAVLFVGTFLLSNFLRGADRGLLCSFSPLFSRPFPGGADVRGELALALIHYATTSQVPQQSRAEIQLTFDVLRRRAPCNFLVFGLGRDSRMWSALNAGGTTLFLEEDKEWYELVLKGSPSLRAHHIKYRTRLDEADKLLKGYRAEAECRPGRADGVAGLRRNGGCPLALVGLPDEVYEKEWDVVMIDAPKGYFPSAPGRMAAIYSAVVMGWGRRGEGQTDVFLHDVDRKVEKAFALEFLCQKNRVGATGRLWHFQIPPVNPNQTSSGSLTFSNECISHDKGLHCDFAYLYNLFRYKLS